MAINKPLSKKQMNALFAAQPRVPFHIGRALTEEELSHGFKAWFAGCKETNHNQPK